MQRIPIEVAQADLPELIEAALSGEEIFIAKNGEHAVLLAPVTRRKFKLGLLDGRLGDGPDFFEPMDRVELELWEGSPAQVLEPPHPVMPGLVPGIHVEPTPEDLRQAHRRGWPGQARP